MKTPHKLKLLPLLLPLTAAADVDLRSGALIQSQQDKLSTLKLERVYHSRSLQKGIFGFGWCSDLDARLELTAEGELYLHDCHRAGPARFLPSSSPRGLAGGAASGAPPAGAGLAFASEELPDEKILYTRDVFTRTSSGRRQTFDGQGRLIELMDAGRQTWKLRRTPAGRLEGLQSASESLLVEMDPLGELVKRIEGRKRLRIDYLYEGDQLRAVAAEKTRRFEYDDTGNLTKILENDKTTFAARYDAGEDRVRTFLDDRKCVENLVWKKNGTKTRIEMTKRCPSRPLARRAVELSAEGAISAITEETKGDLP